MFLLPWYSSMNDHTSFLPCQSMSKLIDYYYSNLSITLRTLQLHYYVSGSQRGAQVSVPPPGQLLLPDVRDVLGVLGPAEPQSRYHSLQSGIRVPV